MTDIGRSGTSGVLLSTLQKIKEGLPKSMSGRIVRDVSQSYGFPLTGQGRIARSLPPVQEVFPRSAVTVADKLKSQMSFAPKALMPGSPTLSLASLGEMFTQAGVDLESQLVYALSDAKHFPVSQSTIDGVRKAIKGKKGFFSLALSDTGVDERLAGKLITLKSGINFGKEFNSAAIERELLPVLEHLNTNITQQVNDGLETIPKAAMARLNEIKREITPLGIQAAPIRAKENNYSWWNKAIYANFIERFYVRP
jgi:hypothetical protein